MLDNNVLDEMKRLISIGQNKGYQHQERLDALFAFEKIYIKLSKEEKRLARCFCIYHIGKGLPYILRRI